MESTKAILEILEGHRGERHIIVLHEYPDPDAIAVGYAHRIIGSAFDIEADILYSGTISHPQNIILEAENYLPEGLPSRLVSSPEIIRRNLTS